MRVEVLDHGYVELIEWWGSDPNIIEAARMSTGKGFLGWGEKGYYLEPESGIGEAEFVPPTVGDEKLLAYLWKNAHHTPFEMAGMVIEVQAPIFVFREWHRHRTQSYNELSARYTPLPNVNYVPTVERLMLNSKTNKQAGTIAGADELNEVYAQEFRNRLEESYEEAELLYKWALTTGVPKELARVHLPVGRYSRMRASANLRNWLAFLTLRTAPAAQHEIRMYANHVAEFVADKFPRTSKLWEEGAK